MHSVSVIPFQPSGIVILTRSRPVLRETQAPYSFFVQLYCFSDLRRDFSSSTEHHSCRIQACSATHATCACMFNHLQHNRLTSTLVQVIRLDLVFYRSQGLSCATSIQHHLGSQLTWSSYLDIIPSHGVSSPIQAHSVMSSSIESRPTCRS